MKKLNFDNLALWQFENLSEQPGIKHYVSNRHFNGAEFTLSLSSTPDKDQVRANRALIAKHLGAKVTYYPSQVHETRVLYVNHSTSLEELQHTDALITDVPGVLISVLSADCVTILLYDKRNHAVGAIHSGWRGTVAKILSITLSTMSSTFGTRAEDLVAGIGPSVCQDSYEVGEDVLMEVRKSFGDYESLVVPTQVGKGKLDLWEANRLQLLQFGVHPENIEISNLCTILNNESFFSARKGDSGRFAAGIMLID